MTVLMTEGFDMYNGVQTNIGLRSKWTDNANNTGVGITGGRFGGQCLQIISVVGGSNATEYSYRLFNPAGNTLTLSAGVALYVVDTTGSEIFLQFDNITNGALFSLGFSSAGGIYAAQGFAGTVLCGSTSGLIANATWNYVEVEAVLSATVGTINLYLNGSLVASGTGLNNFNAGGAGAAFIRCWGRRFGVTSGVLFDDIYVTDTATRLGECRVETLRPTSDNTVAWTPSSGVNNYSRVNETLVDGDSSYVQTSTIGALDLYAIGSLSSTPANIYAVNVVAFAEKTDATTRQLYNSVKSGATSSDGTVASLTASYGRYDRLIATDPNTSAAWTASGVNNLLIGPKVA